MTVGRTKEIKIHRLFIAGSKRGIAFLYLIPQHALAVLRAKIGLVLPLIVVAIFLRPRSSLGSESPPEVYEAFVESEWVLVYFLGLETWWKKGASEDKFPGWDI